jgi:DNA-binding NarL/FixJ family response regulator
MSRCSQGLRSKRPPNRPAEVERTPARPARGPLGVATPWQELTRSQWTARERYIERLVAKGASLKAVGLRYGISTARVARIVEDVRRRRTDPR